MKDLLLILSCKRHELLNRLQMVSGYLQLNKPDKARDYLSQMARELTQEGAICNCKSDRLAIALLTVQSRLNLAGINLKIIVQADLSALGITEDHLVAILEELQQDVQAYVSSNPGALSLGWELEISNLEQGTGWKLSLPGDNSWAEGFASRLRQRLQTIPRGELCTISPTESGLVLFVPKESTL